MQNDIVIVGAARTPVGAFNGALSSLPAHDLGKVAIVEALKRQENLDDRWLPDALTAAAAARSCS